MTGERVAIYNLSLSGQLSEKSILVGEEGIFPALTQQNIEKLRGGKIESPLEIEGKYILPYIVTNWEEELLFVFLEEDPVVKRQERALILFSVIVFMATIVVMFFLVKYILGHFLSPLQGLTFAFQDLEAGNYAVRIKEIKNDEIGRSARSFNIMAEKLAAMLRKAGELSGSMRQRSEDLAQATQQAGGTAEEISASSHEISAFCDVIKKELADNFLALETVQITARQGIETYTDSVMMTSKSMDSLEDSSKQVKSLREKTVKMIRLIKELAGVSQQTEMLALNADIEAGRAVDAGSDFSIIAKEIRKLSAASEDLVIEMLKHLEKSRRQLLLVEEEIEESSVHLGSGSVHITAAKKQLVSTVNDLEKCAVSLQEMIGAVGETGSSCDNLAAYTAEHAGKAMQLNELADNLEELAQEMSKTAESLQKDGGEIIEK